MLEVGKALAWEHVTAQVGDVIHDWTPTSHHRPHKACRLEQLSSLQPLLRRYVTAAGALAWELPEGDDGRLYVEANEVVDEMVEGWGPHGTVAVALELAQPPLACDELVDLDMEMTV